MSPYVSILDQGDVVETCLLQRDSVVSLKTVINNLQEKVTDLQSHIIQMETKLNNQNATSGNVTPTVIPTTVAANARPTTMEVNAIVQPTDDQLPDEQPSDTTTANAIVVTENAHPARMDVPEQPADDTFQLPQEQRKKILKGKMTAPTIHSGIVGNSTATHSFSGTSIPKKTADEVNLHRQL